MDKVITSAGKRFDCDYLATIPSPKRAYIRICNSDFATIATVFSNPRETARIQYGNEIVTGHTRLVSLSNEGNAIKVALAGD